MTKIKNKVTSVTVGKNEAGTALYKDTGLSIEMGDAAFTVTKEDAFNGGTETYYFKNQVSAEMYNDGNDICQILS